MLGIHQFLQLSAVPAAQASTTATILYPGSNTTKTLPVTVKRDISLLRRLALAACSLKGVTGCRRGAQRVV